MALSFTCPHGHQWDDPWGDSLSLAGGSGTVPCPICGAPTEVMSQRSGANPAPSLQISADRKVDSLSTADPPATIATDGPKSGGSAPAGVDIPGYTILDELGRGGMGVVYKARQVGLQRTVALKMILAGPHASPHVLARFRVEALAVARLQHPNIVQIYDIGEHDSRPYFSMEFVDGGNLFDRVREQALPVRQAARLTALMARGMHAAHEQGIVHRDLKSANILMTRDGTPKITDFGLAKDLTDVAGQTRTGEIMGTPSYMSPEQAEGRIKEIGPPTDVYALGAILYELLTARPPFRAETAMDTLLQVLYEEPMPPARLLPNLPRDLETICLKCLSKDIPRRYASALALAEDLERFVDGQPILARPVSRLERTWKWVRRRPAVAALLALSVVAPLAVLFVSIGYNVEQNRLIGLRDEAVRVARKNEDDAKTQEAEAVRQRGIAQKEKDEADRLRHVADQQRLRAERNFLKAREAVRALLTEVAQSDLADLRLMDDLRQRLLARATEFHSEFLEKQGTDADSRRQAGLAYLQLGDICLALGRADEAAVNLDKGIRRFQDLARDNPREPDYRHELAIGLFQRGRLLRQRDQRADAEKAYRAAIDLQRTLADAVPDQLDYRRDLARSLNDLALVLSLTNRPADAEKTYNETIALQEELVRRSADAEPQDAEDLAGSLNDLGKHLRAVGRPADAERAYLRARDRLQKLAERYPKVPSYRQRLAAAYNNLGNVLNDLQGPARAEGPLREALKIRSRLADDFPTRLWFRQEEADTHSNLAIVLANDKKRWPDADREYGAARGIQQKLVDKYPDVPDFHVHLASLLDNLASLRLRQGQPDQAGDLLAEAGRHFQRVPADQATYRQSLRNHSFTVAVTALQRGDKGTPGQHAEAAKAAAELVRLYPDVAKEHQLAAAFLARCAELAGKDKKLDAADRKKLCDVYAVQSVKSLRRAIQLGYADLPKLQKSPDFNAVRDRDDFRKLLAELERKTSP